MSSDPGGVYVAADVDEDDDEDDDDVLSDEEDKEMLTWGSGAAVAGSA